MSVVNRMLQDIDRRRAAALSQNGGGTHAHRDVRGVAKQSDRSRPLRLPIAWLGLALLIVFFVGLSLWNRTTTAPDVAVSNVPTAATATSAVSPSPNASLGAGSAAVVENRATSTSTAPIATIATIEATGSASSTAAARTALQPAERLKLSMQLSALVADAPVERAKRATENANVAPSATGTAIAAPLATSPVPSLPTAAPLTTSSPGKTTITTVPVRQVASDETITAARQLWSDGARASALTTLRDALAAAESARNQRATAPLARELARLEVADNRPQLALDLLKRLENLLSEDADAWALRGNAEQRLGLHADAAQSHLIALRIRPTEGKWMIGAAISLAALGKLDDAQMWAERARERDAVTPAIAAYLQQLGITGRR
jgi:Flp pilus assembly protein TadD